MEKIQPIENFIFDGAVKRLQQTFGCYVQYCNSPDHVLEMQKIRKQVSFPYLLFSLSGMSAIPGYYNSNYLSRHGLMISHTTDNVLQKVKAFETSSIERNVLMEISSILYSLAQA